MLEPHAHEKVNFQHYRKTKMLQIIAFWSSLDTDLEMQHLEWNAKNCSKKKRESFLPTGIQNNSKYTE